MWPIQWSIHVNYAGHCSATAVKIRVVQCLRLGDLMKCHGIYLRNCIPHHIPRHEADNSTAVCFWNVNSHLRHVLSSVQAPNVLWFVYFSRVVQRSGVMHCDVFCWWSTGSNRRHTTCEHSLYAVGRTAFYTEWDSWESSEHKRAMSGEWGDEWEHIHGGWYYHPHSLSHTHTHIHTHTQTSALEFIRVKLSSVFRLWAVIAV